MLDDCGVSCLACKQALTDTVTNLLGFILNLFSYYIIFKEHMPTSCFFVTFLFVEVRINVSYV